MMPQPGQFYMLQAGATCDPLLKRPFSFFDVENGELSFLYRIRGKGTQAIAAMMPGQTLKLIGPLGNAYSTPDGPFIAVAGGIGIASLYSLLRAHPGQAHLFWGGRNENELLLRNEMGILAREVCITTDDGSVGEKGLVTVPLGRFLSSRRDLRVFACGSTPMMRAVAELCSSAGVSCMVSLETYMACGVGACLGCVVRTRDEHHPAGTLKSVCKDGPVFDAATIVWNGTSV
ncbi:MAG TPA: dihydroorotate dehydrogenase electron transfer subunit [Dissulfurispiraceae bacterium]|nr:dihydroorotate dehydrogenase electron transfer subunit [Dissulfurispiraceae bacterium]